MAEFPAEWSELPGHITLSRADDIFGAETGFRVAHQCGAYHAAGVMAVSQRAMAEIPSLEQLVVERLDRYVRPWAYADEVRWPHLEPFPRLEGWRKKIRGMTGRKTTSLGFAVLAFAVHTPRLGLVPPRCQEPTGHLWVRPAADARFR